MATRIAAETIAPNLSALIRRESPLGHTHHLHDKCQNIAAGKYFPVSLQYVDM